MGFAGFKEDIEDLIAERMYMIGGWAATDFKVQSKSFKQPMKYKSKRLSCPICGTIVKKEDLNSHVKIYHENSFDVKINGRRMFDNVINIEKDRVEIICNPYSYKEFEIVFNPGNYIEKVFCETNKYKYDITDKIRRKYFKNLSIFYGNNRIELESKNLFDYEDITIKHIRTKKYTSKSVLKEIGKRSLEVEEKINILKIFIFEKNHVEDIMERFTNDIYDKSKTDELILRANMYFNEKKLKYDNFSLLTQSQWDVIYDIINCSIPKNIVKLNECSTMDYNIICILISAILNNNDLDTDLLESESNSSGILNNILNILLFYRKLDEKSYYGYLKARRKIEDDLDELSIYEDLPIVKLFYNIDYSIIHNISFEDNSLNLVMNISPFFALHQFNICEDESILIGGLNKFPHSIDLKKTAVKYHYPWAINYLTVNEIKKMNELKNSVEKKYSRLFVKNFPISNDYSILRLGPKMIILTMNGINIMLNCGEITEIEAFQNINIDIDYLVITDIDHTNIVNFEGIICTWDNMKIISTPYIYEYLLHCYEIEQSRIIILDENEKYNIKEDKYIMLFNSGSSMLSCGVKIISDALSTIYFDKLSTKNTLVSTSIYKNLTRETCDCMIIGNERGFSNKDYNNILFDLTSKIELTSEQNKDIKVLIHNESELIKLIPLIANLKEKYGAVCFYSSNLNNVVKSYELNKIFNDIVLEDINEKYILIRENINVLREIEIIDCPFFENDINKNELIEIVQDFEPKIILYNEIERTILERVKVIFDDDIIFKQIKGLEQKIYTMED